MFLILRHNRPAHSAHVCCQKHRSKTLWPWVRQLVISWCIIRGVRRCHSQIRGGLTVPYTERQRTLGFIRVLAECPPFWRIEDISYKSPWKAVHRRHTHTDDRWGLSCWQPASSFQQTTGGWNMWDWKINLLSWTDGSCAFSVLWREIHRVFASIRWLFATHVNLYF